jgi:hypothetical protein
MTFDEMLQELPSLTFEQRQQLICRIVKMENLPLNPDVQAMVDARLEASERAPETAIPREVAKAEILEKLNKPSK